MSRSNGHQVHLWKVNWFTKGLYRCEVTADDFETASSSVETEVVGRFQGSLHHPTLVLWLDSFLTWKWINLEFVPAVPTRDPLIEGQKTRYSVGDWVRLNCSSNASLPETELSWYVNSKEVRYKKIFLSIRATVFDIFTLNDPYVAERFSVEISPELPRLILNHENGKIGIRYFSPWYTTMEVFHLSPFPSLLL